MTADEEVLQKRAERTEARRVRHRAPEDLRREAREAVESEHFRLGRSTKGAMASPAYAVGRIMAYLNYLHLTPALAASLIRCVLDRIEVPDD